MNVYKDIDEVLELLKVPFYHGMPEFYETEEPETYISYTLQNKPAFYASGKAKATNVWFSVSVFSTLPNSTLYQLIIDTLALHGYEYQGGRDIGVVTPYPCKNHYSMDFIKIYYKEE